MRFKHQRHESRTPVLNLVPMLDVLMTVLTFFIVVSMTLTLQTGVDIDLPSKDNVALPEKTPEPLVVKLDAQGQLAVNAQPLGSDQLQSLLQTYLRANPKGTVVLQANQQLPYEKVVQLLTEMKAVGGDRVSLAVDE